MLKKIIRLFSEGIARHQSADIDYYLQSKARNESAEYVLSNMMDAKKFHNKYEILKHASLLSPPEGIVCEFGVYKGDTLKFLAKHNIQKKIIGFDSFNGLPSKWRPGFEEGTFKTSIPKFNEKNIQLEVGLFNETLPNFVKKTEEKISLLHIDCDLYESTSCIFTHIWALLNDTCIIVFDEYFNYPQWQEHEHRALMEFIATHSATLEYIAYNYKGEQVSVKISKN